MGSMRRTRGTGKGDGRIGEARNPGPPAWEEGSREQGGMTVDEAWARVQAERGWVPAWRTWSRQVVRPTRQEGRLNIALVPPLVAREEEEQVGGGRDDWDEEDLEAFLQQCELDAGLIPEVDAEEARRRAASWRRWEEEATMAGIACPQIEEQRPSGGERGRQMAVNVAEVVVPPSGERSREASKRDGGKRARQRWKPLRFREVEGEPRVEELHEAPLATERPVEAVPVQRRPARTSTVRPRGKRQRGGPAEHFDVDVITFNGSGSPQLVAALEALEGERKRVAAVLAQEHLARIDAVADLQHAARQRGFKFAPCEAAQGKGGGPSAGVGIAVPLHRGWGGIQGPCWDLSPASSPGRLVGAWIQAGPKGGMFCFSAYLYTSEGMTSRNVGLLEAALSAASTCGGAWIIGADWNVTPKELREGAGRLLDRAGAEVLAPSEATCYPPTGRPRILDYFLVDARMGNAVSEAQVVRTVAGSPHRAVKVTIRGKEVGGLVQMIRRPRMLPRVRPIGCPRRPLVPGVGGEGEAESAEGGGGKGLEEWWRSVAYCIEGELCRECDCVTSDGAPDEKYTGRGEGLRLVRRPLMPPRAAARHGRSDGRLHRLAWTLNRMEEVAHLAGRRGGGWGTETRELQWERVVHSLGKRGGCVERLVEDGKEWEGLVDYVQSLRGRPLQGGEEAREWAVKLRGAVDERKKVVAMEGRAAWRGWVKDQIRRGGGALHAFTKRVVERAEEAAVGSDGRCGSPQTQVESDRLEWDKTWQKLRGIAAAPWREETSGIEDWAALPPRQWRK